MTPDQQARLLAVIVKLAEMCPDTEISCEGTLQLAQASLALANTLSICSTYVPPAVPTINPGDLT